MGSFVRILILLLIFGTTFVSAQETDAVLQAFQKNFVRGNLTTKIQVLQDATQQKDIGMGPLYLQALDFIIDNASIFENDLVARELAVLSIRLIGLTGYRDALYPLWDLFVLDGTRMVRVEILNAIGGLIPIDDRLVHSINSWLSSQNDALRQGEEVDAEVLEEAVVTLGKIGDDSSFPVLFTVSILGGSDEIDKKAREALYSIEGDFKELILRVIEDNSLQEKLEALRIGLANDDLASRQKGQIAEIALKKGIYGPSGQASDREFLRQLRYESIRVLTELSWSQATQDVIIHFEKALEEQTIGIGRTFHVIEAVESLGSMATHEAAVRLALYLDMFPDAPTSRGTRHVRELSYLRNGDTAITDACLVLVVGRAGANVFIPNIHTDPEFSLSLNEAADLITIHAVNLSTDPDGYAKVEKMEVPINFAPVEFLRSNCGVYLLIIKLNAPREIPTGAIGRLWYRSGFYVYVGSAKRGLSHRIHRHAKRKKPLRWHIDYLTAEADVVTAFPIYTNLDLECQLADAIRRTAAHCIPRFGCSDCKCDSHLFRYTSNPLNNRAFVETLFLFRHKSAFAGLSTRPWLDPDVL